MWINPLYRADGARLAIDVIRRSPLAVIVVGSPLLATQMPLLLEEGPEGARELVGHVPIADPIARMLRDGTEVLSVFRGPASYITPSWYVDPGLPTYNFVTVHVRGPAVAMDEEALRRHLHELIEHHESTVRTGSTSMWRPDAVAEERLESLLPRIAGFRIEVLELEAKAKLGQNRQPEESLSVADRLLASGSEQDTQMGALMRDALEGGERQGAELRTP